MKSTRKHSWSQFKLVILLSLSAGWSTQAQSNRLDWSVLAGGGGASTGGIFQVSGTIGQSGAGGRLSGGDFTVDEGFWSLLAVVSSPRAPQLSIRCTAPSTVVISWSSVPTGWTLQQSSDLHPAKWTDVPTVPTDDGTTKNITVSLPVGRMFYRLRQ